MPKEVGTNGPLDNTGAFQSTPRDFANTRGVPERIKWRHCAQEYNAAPTPWASTLQIITQRGAYIFRQRQAPLAPRFRRPDMQNAFCPVNIIQRQLGDLRGAQAGACQ
jgi:hypothetical protein